MNNLYSIYRIFVIVQPHPNPSPSRGRELIRSADKYSPSTGGRGLGGGGAELLRKLYGKGALVSKFITWHYIPLLVWQIALIYPYLFPFKIFTHR